MIDVRTSGKSAVRTLEERRKEMKKALSSIRYPTQIFLDAIENIERETIREEEENRSRGISRLSSS